MPRRISLLSFACLFIAVACTPNSADEPIPSTSSDTTTTEVQSTTSVPADGFGGVVRLAVDRVPESLNPLGPEGALPSTRLVGNLIWATVFDYDPVTFERIPDAVRSLPTSTPGAIETNDDGTFTVQYQITPDARWSDGIPISGSDLAFTAEVMRDEALAGNPNVSPIMASVVDTDSLEQIAWITFDEPSLTFEDALWVILPQHAVGDGGQLDDARDWPSGGPFLADANDPANFERNNFYWKTDTDGQELPYLDGVELVVEPDPVAGLVGDSVDVAELALPDLDDTPGTGAIAFELQSTLTPIYEHLTFSFDADRFSVNDASSNDLVDFRKAVATAIDRPALIEGSEVGWSPDISGVLLPRGGAWNRYTPSSQRARQLIDSLDLEQQPRSVLTTSANAPDRPAVGAELAAAFDGVGIETTLELQDSLALFQTTLPEGAFDLGMWAWSNDLTYTAVLDLLDYFDPATAPAAFSGWGSTEATDNEATQRFSEIAALARTTVDPDEFWILVAEADDLLADQLPLIPILARQTHVATVNDRVAGVVPNGTLSHNTWNIEVWSVPGE